MRHLSFILLFACLIGPALSADDDDLNVEARLRSMGYGSQAWYIDFRVKETALIVNQFRLNRGNCKIGFSGDARKMPLALRFGDTVPLATIGCEPLELEIDTPNGEYDLSLTHIDLRKPIYVSLETPAPNLRRLAITTIKDMKLLKAIVNRGNCGDLKIFDLSGDELRKFGQVYRTGFIPCEPLEVEIITTEGNFTAKF